MNLFSWLSRSKSKSASQLYKEKQDTKFIEALKRIEFTITDRGVLTYHGISEYGAMKYLDEGKEPHKWDKVLTRDGDLISWDEWKAINNVQA